MAKAAAITGACKGLGAEISKLLAEKGYQLVLGSRNKEEIEKFAKEINKITKAVAVTIDVRIKEDCQKFINTTVEKFGRLDVLINNAGVLWKKANIDEVTEEEILNTYEINVFGPIFCSQAAVKIMKKQNSGCIINIGSTSAVDYKTSHIAYGSSKAALVGFTGSLRKELEDTKIKVYCVSPGGMNTNLFRKQLERKTDDFMDPSFVAEKIIDIIDNPPEEWHIIVRRPK